MKNTLIDQYNQYNFFGKLIGMDFRIVSEGMVDYRMTIGQDHLATPRAAHGGVISALIDAALGVAGLSVVQQQNKIVSTIEYKINFLAPALLNDQLLAQAKVEQKGNHFLVVSCDVFCINRQNMLIAKSLGTFNSYDAAKAGYQTS